MPQLELPPFRMPSGGTAGKALLDTVPQGDVIDAFLLKLSGTTFTASNIARLEVIVGGKVAIGLSGDQLDTINKYNGLPYDASYLPIWFADPNAQTRQGWSEGALDTLNRTYSNIQIVCRLDGNQSTDALIEGEMFVGQEKIAPGEQLPQVQSMFRALLDTEQEMVSGTQDFKLHIGTQEGASIYAAHFFSANMTNLEVKRDGVNLVDRLPVGDIAYKQKLKRSPQPDHVAFDPVYNDQHSRSVPTRRPNGTPAPFRWMLTMSASENVTGIAELHTTIDRL